MYLLFVKNVYYLFNQVNAEIKKKSFESIRRDFSEMFYH